MWRKLLEGTSTGDKQVSFALVETTRPQLPPAQMLELVLSGGERLRIPAEEATLRLVLRALVKDA